MGATTVISPVSSGISKRNPPCGLYQPPRNWPGYRIDVTLDKLTGVVRMSGFGHGGGIPEDCQVCVS